MCPASRAQAELAGLGKSVQRSKGFVILRLPGFRCARPRRSQGLVRWRGMSACRLRASSAMVWRNRRPGPQAGAARGGGRIQSKSLPQVALYQGAPALRPRPGMAWRNRDARRCPPRPAQTGGSPAAACEPNCAAAWAFCPIHGRANLNSAVLAKPSEVGRWSGAAGGGREGVAGIKNLPVVGLGRSPQKWLRLDIGKRKALIVAKALNAAHAY